MRFSYHRLFFEACLGVFLVALFLLAVVWPVWTKLPGWLPLQFEFSIPALAFFLLLGANFVFTSSDIELWDDRICWVLWGWRWKQIKWSNIASIKCMSIWIMQSNSRVKMITIRQKNGSGAYFLRRGSLFFSEKIERFDELLALVKMQAVKCNIPFEVSER
jgi:hypothetical protein